MGLSVRAHETEAMTEKGPRGLAQANEERELTERFRGSFGIHGEMDMENKFLLRLTAIVVVMALVVLAAAVWVA